MALNETIVDEEFIERMDEYRKPPKGIGIMQACSDNIVLFAEKMLGIKLYAWQVYFLTKIIKGDKREHVALTSRQIGKSTAVAIFCLWSAIFNKYPGGIHNNTIPGIISASDVQAKKLLYEMKKFMRSGDAYMNDNYKDEEGKPRFGEEFFTNLLDDSEPNNTTTITFQKHKESFGPYVLAGSKIGSVIKSYPPTSAVLGETFTIVIEDEAGKTDKLSDQFHYDYAYPTGNSTDAIRIYTSTPWQPCYSDDTEILTDNGWKLIQDVDMNKDLVASRDSGNKIVFEKPVDKIHEKNYGTMYSLKTKTCDLLVTPEHDLVGYKQKSKKKSYVKAKELMDVNTDFWMDTGINYINNINKDFIVPFIKHKRGNGIQSHEEKILDNNLFSRFLGMFLSDGHTSEGTYSTVITQNPGETLDYYIDLCKRLFPWINVRVVDHSNAKRIILQNKQLYLFMRSFKVKGFDPFNYSVKQLNDLWLGLHDGDGNKTLTWKNKLKSNVVTMDNKYPKLNDSVNLLQQILFGGKIDNSNVFSFKMEENLREFIE
ncbi:MAG: hypothetical protein DRN81_04700, partial [Thermoproteota archaeon]